MNYIVDNKPRLQPTVGGWDAEPEAISCPPPQSEGAGWSFMEPQALKASADWFKPKQLSDWRGYEAQVSGLQFTRELLDAAPQKQGGDSKKKRNQTRT